MTISPKLGRMATYLNCLLPMKSNDDIITWFVRSRDKLKT